MGPQRAVAVIDVDVSEVAFVDALASAFDQSFPELFAHGLVRHAGGPKEAWIARVDVPFVRLASRDHRPMAGALCAPASATAKSFRSRRARDAL